MAATILSVEDEADVTNLVRFHLVKSGYEVLTAASGREASGNYPGSSAGPHHPRLDVARHRWLRHLRNPPAPGQHGRHSRGLAHGLGHFGRAASGTRASERWIISRSLSVQRSSWSGCDACSTFARTRARSRREQVGAPRTDSFATAVHAGHPDHGGPPRAG